MPSLRELQVRVLDAVLGAAPMDAAAALVALPGASALARLEIYRNTARANFADALASTYPAIRRLVGEDYFRQTARHFQLVHPSRSGDLQHVGAHFPDYLLELHGKDRFRYLADVALLEWQIERTLLAKDHAPLDLAKLAAVDPSSYGRLRFELHPMLGLLQSRHPVLAIWETNARNDVDAGLHGDVEPIDLDSGGDLLAVMRQGSQLRIHRLSAGEHRFLRAIERGDDFAAAVAAAASTGEAGGTFDAAAALRRFVAAEAIVDFRPLPMKPK